MGYGTKALELLCKYYEGKFINIDIDNNMEESDEDNKTDNKGKKKLKPLLSKLEDVKPPFIYYLGTSFGLTNNLYNFWQKNGYKALYLAMNSNSITGEHSCIMIKPINEGNIKVLNEEINMDQKIIKWFEPFSSDFKHRFISLLSFNFNKLDIKLCLSILEPEVTTSTAKNNDNDDNEYENKKDMNKNEIELFITKFDFKRLELYSRNMTNYNNIIDLIPVIAHLYFNKKIFVSLSYIQAGVLLGVGLQRKNFDDIVKEFNIEINQLLAMFNKMVKKFVNYIKNIYTKEIEYEEEIDMNKNKEILKTKNENKGNVLKEMQKELKSEGDKIIEKDREVKKKYMEEKLKKMEKKEELMTKKKRKRDKKEDDDNDIDKNDKSESD